MCQLQPSDSDIAGKTQQVPQHGHWAKRLRCYLMQRATRRVVAVGSEEERARLVVEIVVKCSRRAGTQLITSRDNRHTSAHSTASWPVSGGPHGRLC